MLETGDCYDRLYKIFQNAHETLFFSLFTTTTRTCQDAKNLLVFRFEKSLSIYSLGFSIRSFTLDQKHKLKTVCWCVLSLYHDTEQAIFFEGRTHVLDKFNVSITDIEVAVLYQFFWHYLPVRAQAFTNESIRMRGVCFMSYLL